jgi:hypothetical protein
MQVFKIFGNRFDDFFCISFLFDKCRRCWTKLGV